jgi:hypothetical protein
MKLTNFETSRDFGKDIWVLIPSVVIAYEDRTIELTAGFLFFKFSISWKH